MSLKFDMLARFPQYCTGFNIASMISIYFCWLILLFPIQIKFCGQLNMILDRINKLNNYFNI